MTMITKVKNWLC